ncbi:hypothetical protein [Ferruginibacter sp.]|nr:hypothetical protein [Ferruginibacter sp.]
MKNILLILLAAVVITASCKKNTVTVNNNPGYSATVKVKYGGDPLADGSGWHLFKEEVNGPVFLFPDNMPDSFKVLELEVDVVYTKTNKDLPCHCVPPFPKMIHIESIKKH